MQTVDNFAYVVPVDVLVHTADKPYCFEQSCPCHADLDAYLEVQRYVAHGLITFTEAERFIAGKTV